MVFKDVAKLITKFSTIFIVVINAIIDLISKLADVIN